MLSLVNGFLVKRDFGEGATDDSDLESKRCKIGELDDDSTHGESCSPSLGIPNPASRDRVSFNFLEQHSGAADQRLSRGDQSFRLVEFRVVDGRSLAQKLISLGDEGVRFIQDSPGLPFNFRCVFRAGLRFRQCRARAFNPWFVRVRHGALSSLATDCPSLSQYTFHTEPAPTPGGHPSTGNEAGADWVELAPAPVQLPSIHGTPSTERISRWAGSDAFDFHTARHPNFNDSAKKNSGSVNEEGVAHGTLKSPLR